jgi:nucleotide-binding universal stress UspA family protein
MSGQQKGSVVNPSVIVCPVEFSPSGKAALRHALTHAHWHGAQLHVLHVRPGRHLRVPAVMSTDDQFYRRLVDFVRSLNPEEVTVTPVVLAGDPAKAVAEYARLKSADLLVVGQNGRRGSRFWSSGVLATDLARAVQCATLTVPSEAVAGFEANAPFNNIVCGIDFLPASYYALTKALALAQQSGGRVTLLHVLEGFPYESVYSGSRASQLIGEYRTRVKKVTSELRALVPHEALNWCEVETEVVSGIPHDAIVAEATARRADLVVIGLPRRTRLDRIVMASTVACVLRRVRCPVFTVPGPSGVTDAISQSIAARSNTGFESSSTMQRLAGKAAAQDVGALSW